MSLRLPRSLLPYGAAWLAFALLAGLLLVRAERGQHHDAFQTDARIMHRLLSQKAVQHEAILSTLALLQPHDAAGRDAIARLPSVMPQILRVERRTGDEGWPLAALAEAEVQSRQLRRAVLVKLGEQRAHFWVLLAASPGSYALEIDAQAMVPWEEWPLPQTGSPVAVSLQYGDQRIVLHEGLAERAGWLGQQLAFEKTIAAESQPFKVVVHRQLSWHSLPWGKWLLWCLGGALLSALLARMQMQAQARKRAEELLRFGQIARLNTLGELAAGLAHELNQPLAAVSANTQAARRLLDESPPELDTARTAMAQAVVQARRAAEVLGRLRRAIERPGLAERSEAVGLLAAAHKVLDLLQAECQGAGIVPELVGDAGIKVMADPVALEQIIHNLLMNALQAMRSQPGGAPRLLVQLATDAGEASLSVLDTGPGIPPEALPRLFEPFFSTREGGLGLGLSLCETLATGMGGRLTAANRAQGGAVFCLTLPLAAPETAA